MPEPISLCIENTETLDEEVQFIRCVALAGNRAGLAVDQRGRPMWIDTDGCACELWVSADDQLILLRPAGAVVVRVARAGRSLEVPADKPVVVLDQDEIEVGGVLLRLHVHGFTTEVHPPAPFVPARATAAALAAAVAFGAVAGCDRSDEPGSTESTGQVTTAATTATATATAGETRAVGSSSSTATTSSAASTTASSASTSTSSAATSVTTPAPTNPPIQVRPHPPKPARPSPVDEL